MAFDLSSARPVYPASAPSDSAGGFDLASATPVYPQAQPQQQPSMIDGALSTLDRIGRGVLSAGPLETATHLGSAAVGGLAGGLGFLGQYAENGGDADDAVAMQHRIQQDLTYQPRTKAGKAMSSAMDKAMGVIPRGLDKAGEVTADVTGSPLLGAAVNTGGNALLNLLPLKGAARGITAGADDVALGMRPTTRPAPTTPAELTRQSLDNGQQVGYQAPPSLDPNASTFSRWMQSVASKANGEQRAAVPNQAVTNALAARSIGLDPASLITKGPGSNLQAIRQAAHEHGYEPIKTLEGDIPVDTQFLRNNASIKATHANEFSANPDVETAAGLLNRASFAPDKITDYIGTLRSKASDAFAQGRSDAGTALRKQAAELESLLDRHIDNLDNAPAGMLTKYRAARQLIAKTHTVEENLNPSTGNVDATGIGAALKAGVPLDGDLRTIADFANAAPAATVVPKGIPLPSSAASHLAGAALAHATGGASFLGIPAARAFAAKYIAQRNETPALLQPSNKSLGQTALDAVHQNASAFSRLYGGAAPGATASTSGN